MGMRVVTNAHSVEYGSVVRVQRRGEDGKHAAVVEAVGNECDRALLRVDSLFPPRTIGDVDRGDDAGDKTFAMPLGPLPAFQDEVVLLSYPAGGDSLCITKGVVSRVEMQEYAQADNGSEAAAKGLKRRSTGVMIWKVQPTSGAVSVLRGMDVVLAIEGIPLGTDGKIPFRCGEMVDWADT